MPIPAKETEICPLCKQPLVEPSVACPQCGGRYHRSCWDQNGGCGNFGCASTDEAAPPTSPDQAKVDRLVSTIKEESVPNSSIQKVAAAMSDTGAIATAKRAKSNITEPPPRPPTAKSKFLTVVVGAAGLFVFFLTILIAPKVYSFIAGKKNPGPAAVNDTSGIIKRRNARSVSASPERKWAVRIGGELYDHPAIGPDGTIYVGSDNTKVYAINPDGTKKWVFATEDAVDSAPVIGPDGTVYVASNDTKLYAINQDGTSKWNFPTAGWLGSSPAIGPDGTVYVGSSDNRLYAVNPDGTKKWDFATGDTILDSPAISSDGTIYVGSWDNSFYALNPDGSKKWEFATGEPVISTPVFGRDGTVYISFYDKFYALDPNGAKKWELAGGVPDGGYALGSDDTIYAAARKLRAMDPDGTRQWKFAAGDSMNCTPVIGADGTIYVGSWDDKLNAVNPDGSKKWELSLSTGMGGPHPAIASDGTIYVANSNGMLYAIGVGGK